MPIYEYQCTGCHHEFDLMQKFSDEPIKQCPQCHKNTVVRLVSAAGFQLKGTGWYATDFKNKGKPENATTDVSKNTDTSTEAKKPTESTKSTQSSKGETD